MTDQVNNPSTNPSAQPQDTKSVVSAVSAVPPVKATEMPTESSKLDVLLRLMLSQEARKAEEIENLEVARRARSAQRELSARTHVEKQLIKQARCRHMKGGKKGPRSGVTDYAVYLHTFINGENIIKCFICGMKWKMRDTTEFLVRGGRQIANHTKIGWAQASGFLAQSTNTASSSEVPMEARPAAEFSGTEI